MKQEKPDYRQIELIKFTYDPTFVPANQDQSKKVPYEQTKKQEIHEKRMRRLEKAKQMRLFKQPDPKPEDLETRVSTMAKEHVYTRYKRPPKSEPPVRPPPPPFPMYFIHWEGEDKKPEPLPRGDFE